MVIPAQVDRDDVATVPTLDDVRAARRTLDGMARRTPVLADEVLSRRLGVDLYIKAEHMQRGGSFKFRGMYNAVQALGAVERAAGIITISSGNAGLAAALAARLERLPCTVVLPECVAAAKLARFQQCGATVVQHGRSDAQMLAHAIELIDVHGQTLVHPFDDPDVIAGHATLGLELVEDDPPPDYVVVPASGGGLLAGVGLVVKSLHPQTQVIGVQPAGADGIRRSLDLGYVRASETVHTLADSLTGEAPGALPFAIIQRCVDDVVLVSDDQILAAMKVLWELGHEVEPAGAAAVAAVMSDQRFRGRVLAVTTGANVDEGLLAHAIGGGSAADWRCRQTVGRRSS